MQRGTLHLICGLPGSGKTTLAKQLAAKKNAVRFCPDEWILPIMEDPVDGPENKRIREPIEQSLWKLAQELLKKGVSVILENGFWSKEERDGYLVTGKKLGAKVELYFLDTPFEALWSRVKTRNSNPNEFRLTKDQLSHYSTLFQAPTEEEGQTYDHFERV